MRLDRVKWDSMCLESMGWWYEIGIDRVKWDSMCLVEGVVVYDGIGWSGMAGVWDRWGDAMRWDRVGRSWNSAL